MVLLSHVLILVCLDMMNLVLAFQSSCGSARTSFSVTATPCPSTTAMESRGYMQQSPKKLLIHWKGEGIEGYSMQFRFREFLGALSSVLGREATVKLQDALQYKGSSEMSSVKLVQFEQAMQFMTLEDPTIARADIAQAVRRSSLIHDVFEVVAEGESYEELSNVAQRDGGFNDLASGGENEDATWCVRVREYNSLSAQSAQESKERRYGARTRSMQRERQALCDLEALLLTFGGGVDLNNPQCKIYIFDGLVDGSALTRRLAQGAQVSSIAPPTRFCVTNTPLCAMAAFIMCNLGRLRPNQRVLDPFAGSCAILLAAVTIEPSVQCIGIEIAHDGLVNRDDIRRDFESRGLPVPCALLRGDSSDDRVLQESLSVVDNDPFDLIVTDPPYGIRESIRDESDEAGTPVDGFLKALAQRRKTTQPLLRRDGGRFVCFLPSYRPTEDDVLRPTSCLVMPSSSLLEAAGLRLLDCVEQPLNDRLSRWLVVFVSVPNNTL